MILGLTGAFIHDVKAEIGCCLESAREKEQKDVSS